VCVCMCVMLWAMLPEIKAMMMMMITLMDRIQNGDTLAELSVRCSASVGLRNSVCWPCWDATVYNCTKPRYTSMDFCAKRSSTATWNSSFVAMLLLNTILSSCTSHSSHLLSGNFKLRMFAHVMSRCDLNLLTLNFYSTSGVMRLNSLS